MSFLIVVALVAQVQSTPPPSRRDDIVVTAPVDRRPLPTLTAPATNGGLMNRKVYENSQLIAKCAMRTSLPKLRAAIDGAPNTANQRAAQAWLIRRTATCNNDAAILAREPWDEGNVRAAVISDYGTTTTETDSSRSVAGTLIYDRGALIEQVFRTYAPDVTLTRDETRDAAVQQRFDARERPRNGARDPVDLEYFKVAVCMVRMEPQLATRMLAVSPGSAEQKRLQATMINGARVCVGNAKRVYVDATQFRIYVIDALYRWVLAARGVPSLLPEGV